MIIIDIRFTIPAIALLVPAAAAIVIWVRQSRKHNADLLTISWRILAILYTALLLAVTMFPFQVVIGVHASDITWLGGVNWEPFTRIDPTNFLLNVLMTLPLGVLLPVLTTRRRFGQAVLTGALVSLSIETLQYVCQKLLSGGRTIDVNDVLANIIGVALGYAIFRTCLLVPGFSRLLPPQLASSVLGRKDSSSFDTTRRSDEPSAALTSGVDVSLDPIAVRVDDPVDQHPRDPRRIRSSLQENASLASGQSPI